MNWYLVPIYKKEKDGQITYVPGYKVEEEIFEISLASYICHAHNPKLEPTFALLGLKNFTSTLPNGWTSKTLSEAKEYFKFINNREASEKEIF